MLCTIVQITIKSHNRIIRQLIIEGPDDDVQLGVSEICEEFPIRFSAYHMPDGYQHI